jgi:hypothetical protein
MKKFFTIGMAVLLGVSLSFLGCEDKAEEAKEPTAAELAAELAETLGTGAAVDETDATKVNVTGAVEVKEAVEVKAGVTLEVGAGGTLTVKADKTLTVTGTLTGTGTGKIVLEGTATVTGGTFYTAGETAGEAVAGTTYDWAADAGGTGTAGWQEAFTNTNAYTLKATSASDAAADASGLTIAYARKATVSGKTYIKLGGAIAAAHQLVSNGTEVTTNAFTNWDTNEWGNGPGSTYVPAAGKYKAVALNGLFPAETSNVAIKNSNFAFHYYDGSGSYNFLTTTAPTAPQIREQAGGTALENPPADVYLPTDLTIKPFKWKLYSSAFTAGETFSLLIWSEAPDKTVTLDIDQYGSFAVSGAPTKLATVVIDYSGVTWN